MPSDDQISLRRLQIKPQEDRFFSRLLSKEASSAANSSFRVYYGGSSGSVPFVWESQPGTPKHAFSDDTVLPPLTPPPSYFSAANSNRKSAKKNLKSNAVTGAFLFPRLTSIRVVRAVPPSSLSSSSSSISYASPSSSSLSLSRSSSCSSQSASMSQKLHKRRRFSGRVETVPYLADEEKEENCSSPKSTLCFGAFSKSSESSGGFSGMLSVKKALLSLVGHGSAGCRSSA